VNPAPYPLFTLFNDSQVKFLVEYSETDVINSRKYDIDVVAIKPILERPTGWTKTNKYLIDVRDNRITLGANGKILTKLTDKTLRGGSIGFYMIMLNNSYAEVRFRNIKIYSK